MTTIFIASFLTFFPYINFIYLFNNSLLFQNEHFEIQLGNYSWFNYGLLIMLLFNSGIVIYRHKINIIQLIHNDKY
jgi:glycerol-3-phosphate acyltransferase PlsY